MKRLTRVACYFCGALSFEGALCPDCKAQQQEPGASVKRVDIFGQVYDTHRTEADLNGWREKQGSLFA